VLLVLFLILFTLGGGISVTLTIGGCVGYDEFSVEFCLPVVFCATDICSVVLVWLVGVFVLFVAG
jgi:hypothetical protein